MSTAHASAPPKEQSELLHGILSRLYRRLIDFEFKNGAIVLAIMAWVLTAKTAQQMIAASVPITVSFTLVMLLHTAFHATWVIHFYLRSVHIYDQLKDVGYMPTHYFNHERIARFLAISFCVVHFAVTILVLVVVWSL